MLERSVLVLNQNYEPMSVCSVRRALLLILRGKAETVEKLGVDVAPRADGWCCPSAIYSSATTTGASIVGTAIAS